MMLTRIAARIFLSTVAVAMIAITVVAQETEKKITAKQVPAVVIVNFKAAYPKAVIRGYAKEIEDGKQYYEIESREGALHRDVLYNPDGTVAEIEESIASSGLPQAAVEAMKAKYPKGAISLAEKTTAGDKITYEVKGRQGRKSFTMEFDADGKPLSRTKG